MECFQVLYRARAPEVEGVLADAAVASPRGPAVARCGRVCVRSSCAPAGPRARRRSAPADAAAPRSRSFAAIRTERPWPRAAVVHCARTGHGSQTSGSNSTVVPNDTRCICPWGQAIVRSRRLRGKADLGEQAAVGGSPRSTDNRAAPAEHVVDEGTVDVAAIDQQVVDGEALPLKVDRQGRRGLRLGAIGGRDGARQDQPAIDIRREMPLEAIEPLALTLAAVAHVRIRDRDAAIFGDALANAAPPRSGSGSRSCARICASVSALPFKRRPATSSGRRCAIHACRVSS